METRANHVWVGVVTLTLAALLALAAVWLSRASEAKRNYYDIFFRQSVDGLAKGAQVTYSGVPAGEITRIELWKDDPGLVRVRVGLNPRIPVLLGTTASIQGSFTGVSTIQLAGGIKGQPPITEPGPTGVPVIPTTRTGLGALLSSAPALMEKFNAVTDQVSKMFSDANIREVSGILVNTNRVTKNLAAASPDLRASIGQLQSTLLRADAALAQFSQVAANANRDLDPNANGPARQLGETLKSAQAAATTLQAEIAELHPVTQQLTTTTMPQAEATLRELRETARSLRALTDRIQDHGAAAVLGPPKLPEYKP